MNSQINELLKNQDNAEIIRDRIAAILKLEFANQKVLADNDSTVENKKDFNIKVYMENSRPWELISNNGKNNPFPLVNVCLQETNEDQNKPGGIVGKIKYTGTYYIDCYGCGNYRPIEAENENTEYIPDDSLSAIRAWHTARITRNILMSGQYAYLGMQGIVMRRRITKITTVIPNGLDASAISITACRVIFEVELYEISPEAIGENFEGITFRANAAGEVNLDNEEIILIDIMTDNTKENLKE
jgi:hypothetical protein